MQLHRQISCKALSTIPREQLPPSTFGNIALCSQSENEVLITKVKWLFNRKPREQVTSECDVLRSARITPRKRSGTLRGGRRSGNTKKKRRKVYDSLGEQMRYRSEQRSVADHPRCASVLSIALRINLSRRTGRRCRRARREAC